jgi:hypothetical protein
MPAENAPASRRTAGELMSEIDLADAELDALLEFFAAAGENKLTASKVHLALLPVRSRLSSAAEALNQLLGR